MNKMTFDTLPEAKEYVAFAKSHGYEISDPVKVKRPKTARKMYDLNGKPLTYRYEVTMGVRGAGKRGAHLKDEDKEYRTRRSGDKAGRDSGDIDDEVKEMRKEELRKELSDSDKDDEETAHYRYHRYKGGASEDDVLDDLVERAMEKEGLSDD